jgi:hypothetical protein
MPHTTRIRARLARHLLLHPNHELRRRIGILREMPFPPGSCSLAASDEWEALQQVVPAEKQGFIYGAADNAVVYTYQASSEELSVELAIVHGQLVGEEG